VRLGAYVSRRVKVPSWRSFLPLTESNCESVRAGGEQLEVNGWSVEKTRDKACRHKLDSA
jgi:hypothetical protein